MLDRNCTQTCKIPHSEWNAKLIQSVECREKMLIEIKQLDPVQDQLDRDQLELTRKEYLAMNVKFCSNSSIDDKIVEKSVLCNVYSGEWNIT